MASKKHLKMTAEERAQRDATQRRARERIAEREAIEREMEAARAKREK